MPEMSERGYCLGCSGWGRTGQMGCFMAVEGIHVQVGMLMCVCGGGTLSLSLSLWVGVHPGGGADFFIGWTPYSLIESQPCSPSPPLPPGLPWLFLT